MAPHLGALEQRVLLSTLPFREQCQATRVAPTADDLCAGPRLVPQEIADQYIAPVVGRYTDWTPLHGRGKLFPEPHLDLTDPWQFCNVRVV